MRSINLADAKAHLSKLVEQAEAGDPVHILRRGKPVAQITAIMAPRRAIDPDMLRAMTEAMPRQSESAGKFILRMRDEDRY